MRQLVKWLLLGVIVVEIVLVRGGVLDLRDALIAGVAFEALLALFVAVQLVRGWRRYRREHAGGTKVGFDGWQAFEAALASILPLPVARLVALEARLWHCFWLWAGRRVPRGPDVFPYHRRSPMGALLVVVLFSAPVEVLLFELLIPWGWLRWLLLVGSVYAAFWFVCLYAGLRALPHRLRGDELYLRYSAVTEGRVRLADIATIEPAPQRLKTGNEGVQVDAAEATACFAIGGRTDLRLELFAPVQLRTLRGLSAPVRVIHIAVDEPERLRSALLERGVGMATANAASTIVAGR
jgi:hypothetical protein